MEADPYGFCHDLEKDAAKLLKHAGRTALVKQIRERFDATGTTKSRPGESFLRDAVYARRRWGDALRTLYRAEKNVEAYLALVFDNVVRSLTPSAGGVVGVTLI